MKTILVVLLLTLSAFAATTIVSAERWDLSLDAAIHDAVGSMADSCVGGNLSDAKVVRQWDVNYPTYTEYHVEMTATCTTK